MDHSKTAHVNTTGNDFIFQQGGATSHTSHRTQQHLKDAALAFINIGWMVAPRIEGNILFNDAPNTF